MCRTTHFRAASTYTADIPVQGRSLRMAPAGQRRALWLHVCGSHLCHARVVPQGCTCNAGVVFRIIGWGTGQPLLGAKTVAGMLMISTIVGEPVSAKPHR